MKPKIKLLFSLIILLSGISQTNAQDRNFEHFSLRSGIPSGYISQMVEDRYGYIWIGTNGGLSQFDGYGFVNFVQKPSDSLSIKGSRVNDIKEYDGKTMLVATADALNVFDRKSGAFRLILVKDSIPTLDKVLDLAIMDNKDVWVLSANGLYFIQANELQEKISRVSFFEFPESNEIPDRNGSIAFDGKASLYLGSASQPFQRFDIEKKEFIPLTPYGTEIDQFFKAPIWDMLFHPNGNLFVVGDKGLLRWDSNDAMPELVNPSGYFKPEMLRFFQSITLDSEGRLLIGTGESGAIRWDFETDEVYGFVNDPEDVNTVNSNDVHYLFEDKNSNLWFGHHFEGLSMMYVNSLDYTYKNLTKVLKLDSAVNLFHMSEDDEGNLWFPTDQGLIKQSNNNATPNVYSPKEEASLNSVVAYKDKLFLSSVGNGGINKLFTFDVENGSFTKIYESDSVNIYPLPNQTSDLIFLPTASGFLEIDKRTEKAELITPPLNEILKGNRTVFNAAQDVEGNLIAESYYLGTDDIIESFLYDREQRIFKKTTVEKKFNTENRTPDFVSRSEPMTTWSRSQFGLSKTNLSSGEAVMYFEGEPLLKENGTGSLVEDDDGYIWMNNTTGIMRLDPATQTIAQYQINKEIKPEWFRRPYNLKNGDILFTATDGYLRFNPKQTQAEFAVNNLLLTELKVSDNSYNLLFDEIPESFSFDDNDVSISYIAFNYLDPIGTRYRYRVKGFNESWTNVEGQRRVFLANLPSGKYMFEVQSATRFGAFGKTQSIPFVILPPWWLTWWAFTIYSLLFVLFLLLVHRVQKARTIRIEREKNRDIKLAQAQEIEKAYKQLQNTQNQLIQAEKMASLGELTAGIAHEIQNPLNFVNNFADLNRELIEEMKEEIENKNYAEAVEISDDLKANEEKIIHHGKRAEEIVKSMLLHSRGSEGKREVININSLADEYLRLSYHGLRAKDKSFNAEFKLDLEESLPQVEVIPQDIGRVLLNLINNAFHATTEKARSGINGYSPTVEVITKSNNSHIEVVIQDNGSGIPDNIKEKIFQPFFTTKAAGSGTGLGLSMSYDIVTKGHNGTLKVESEEGKSTTFTVSLPKNASN